VEWVLQFLYVIRDDVGNKNSSIANCIFYLTKKSNRRSRRPRGLRRRSAAARPLRSWVQIPTGSWIFVCCECCALSGRGLCDELITRPEEPYRLWCVVCDLETSRMRRPWPALGRSVTEKKKSNQPEDGSLLEPKHVVERNNVKKCT
jgi:hypothetical protein